MRLVTEPWSRSLPRLVASRAEPLAVRQAPLPLPYRPRRQDGGMKNPWLKLPRRPPYVLPDDRPYVEEFNQWWPARHHHHINLEMFPDPFVGARDAPVVVLARNPGIGGAADRRLHRSRTDLLAVMRRQLTSPPTRARHTYLLDEFAHSPGGRWWRGALARLEEDGIERSVLLSGVLAVEFHGYHSETYTTMPITLPSQRYGFWLVDEAIASGAVIVMMRGQRDWSIAVPDLSQYERIVVNGNPRTSSISPATYGAKGYGLIRSALS